MAEIYSLAAERRRRFIAAARPPAPVIVPVGKQPGDFVRLWDGRRGCITHVALGAGDGEAAIELVVLTNTGAVVTRADAVTPIERYCQ